MKVWQIVAVVVLVVGAVFAVWKIGELQGSSSTRAVYEQKLKDKDAAVAADKLAAVRAASEAQKKLDAQALDDANAKIAVLAKAVAAAKAETAKSEETNRRLNSDYERLKANDQDIRKWGDSCLPAGILGSLHGPAYKAGKQCTP